MVPSTSSAVPPTSPRSVMLVATLFPCTGAPSELVSISLGVPSFSQSTACGPPGGPFGGRGVLPQRPDTPTASPSSLIPKANETLSPGRGFSGRGLRCASQMTPTKRVTWKGTAQVVSGTPVSDKPAISFRLLIEYAWLL